VLFPTIIINKCKPECMCRKFRANKKFPQILYYTKELNGQENNIHMTRKTLVCDCVERL